VVRHPRTPLRQDAAIGSSIRVRLGKGALAARVEDR
jgi:hypothetical protein